MQMNDLYEIFVRLVNDLKDKDENQIISVYDNIADLLLYRGYVKVNANEFKIREIEFYYNSENHKDIFTHNNEKQFTSLQWYFHPSLKGVDLTIGNGINYGGILIRAINGDKNEKLINGPEKVLKKILCAQTNNIFQNNTISVLFDDIHIGNEKFILSLKRIGIKISDIRDEKLQKNFIDKTYRYLSIEEDKNLNYNGKNYEIPICFAKKYPELDPEHYFNLDKSTWEKYKKENQF